MTRQDGRAMSVLLAALTLDGPVTNGSKRYFRALAGELGRTHGPHVTAHQMTHASAPGALRPLADRALMASWALQGIPRVKPVVRDERLDLVHSVESVFVPRVSNAPLVVTVHDACALMRPDLVSWKIALLQRLSWRRAREWDGIIVPSHSTKRDLVALGAAPDRVTIVRHGLDERFRQPPSEASRERIDRVVGGRPFVLVVGPLSRKKGSDVLLRAWSSTSPSKALLLWVGPTLSRSARERFRSRDLVFPGRLRDEDLVAAYNAARAVVVPSRWEGFSFGVAEAVAAGTPVIASDIPVHRELGGGSIDTYAPEDAARLRELLGAAAAGAARGAPSPYRSWADAASETAGVYRAVVERWRERRGT